MNKLKFVISGDELRNHNGVISEHYIDKRIIEEIGEIFTLELYDIEIENKNVDTDSYLYDLQVTVEYSVSLKLNKIKELEEIQERLKVGL